jgi:hypothetical protein
MVHQNRRITMPVLNMLPCWSLDDAGRTGSSATFFLLQTTAYRQNARIEAPATAATDMPAMTPPEIPA